jgi:hypothetical protein
MPDHLETINKAITEHHDIRENVPLTEGTVTDVEALFVLRQAYAKWSQCTPEELAAMQQQLLETLNSVEQGLRIHWNYEEKALPPVFGEVLMKALVYEHNEITGRIKAARAVLTGNKLDGLEQQELLSRKTAIHEAINHVLQVIEEHSNHEEMIFKMMKKALEGPARP